MWHDHCEDHCDSGSPVPMALRSPSTFRWGWRRPRQRLVPGTVAACADPGQGGAGPRGRYPAPTRGSPYPPLRCGRGVAHLARQAAHGGAWHHRGGACSPACPRRAYRARQQATQEGAPSARPALRRARSVGGDPSGQNCEQRDVAILRSLPGVGRIILATLLAEARSLSAAGITTSYAPCPAWLR